MKTIQIVNKCKNIIIFSPRLGFSFTHCYSKDDVFIADYDNVSTKIFNRYVFWDDKRDKIINALELWVYDQI